MFFFNHIRYSSKKNKMDIIINKKNIEHTIQNILLQKTLDKIEIELIKLTIFQLNGNFIFLLPFFLFTLLDNNINEFKVILIIFQISNK